MTACSETIRRFSSKHVAYSFVEMERARNDLEAHHKECASASAAFPGVAVAAAAMQHS
jgi:hypothetical protein